MNAQSDPRDDARLELELESRHRPLSRSERLELAAARERAPAGSRDLDAVLEGLDLVRSVRPELPAGFEARLFERLAAEQARGVGSLRRAADPAGREPAVRGFAAFLAFLLGRDARRNSQPTILLRRLVAVYAGIAVVLLPWWFLHGSSEPVRGRSSAAVAAYIPAPVLPDEEPSQPR